MKKMDFWMITAGAVLGGAGCAGAEEPLPRPGDVPGEQMLIGVEWGSDAFIEREVLDFAPDYTHRLASDRYMGNTFVRVQRRYDLTDVSDSGHEQILRLRTAHDEEELSTWADDVRAVSTGRSDDVFNVDLAFPAVLSSDPTPHNGILEIHPEEADTLEVEWEYPAETDLATIEFPLERVDG